jgi:AcrR family transcriptional regulator
MNVLVQNARPHAARVPGRPPEFDSRQVVSDAVTVFWRNGYDGTSLAELEDELGVNRSTLYASFDGKAGLYRSAVASYIDTMEARLVAPLLSGTAGVDDLVAFVERLRAVLTDPAQPDGCLIVNAMGSGNPPDEMTRYLNHLRAGFDATLRRAAELDEITDDSRPDKGSSILTSAIGLNVAAKAGIDGPDLDHLIDGVRAVIESWNQTRP